MKTAIVILTLAAILIVTSCCNPGSEPGPPYGKPDDVTRYSGSNGYESIDYTYYCLGGEYVSVTYVRIDECAEYVLDSTFRTSGICD